MNRLLLLLLALFPMVLSAQSVPLIVANEDFLGNRRFTDRELAKLTLSEPDTPYDPATAREDARRIADHYAAAGDYTVRVQAPLVQMTTDNRVRLTYIIEERAPVVLDTLYISGARVISERRLREMLPRANSFADMDALVQRIPQLYADRGYLFAACSLDSLGWQGNQAAVWLRVEEGPLCRPQRFRFEGNTNTRPGTVLKIAQARRVDVLTLPLLRRMEENLGRKDYITEAEVIPLDAQTVLFRLKEGRQTTFYALLGYNNISDDDNANTLTGRVKLEFLNLFGTDRSLLLNWQRLTRYRSSIEFSYHESGPGDWPFAADLTLYREEVDSTYIQSTVDMEVYYYTLVQKVGIYAGVDDYMPGSRRPQTIEKASYKKIGGLWSWSGEDYLRNPTRGESADVLVYRVYNRKEGEANWKTATEFDLAHYQPLGLNFVLALALHGRGYSTTNVADYEQFEMGGATSLRGFYENLYAGYRLGWATAELRRLLGRDSRAYAFIDYGVVDWADDDGPPSRSDLFGVGLGLRVMTRIGQFQLDYAVKHDEIGWANPFDGIVHFGIQTDF